MKQVRFLLIGVLVLLQTFAAHSKSIEITLGKIKLMNDLVEIKIPTHFSALLDHEMKQMYPARQPKVAYADSARSVKLAFFSERYNEMKDAGTGALKAEKINGFLKEDPKAKELSSGLETVDGRDMAYSGILHKSPEKVYRFFFLTEFKGIVLSGELLSPKKGYKNWLGVAPEIMRSLDIKGD